MKHIKEFLKFNESVNGGGDGRFDVTTDELIEIFKKLSEDDYEKIVDFFAMDWDSYDMVEEINIKLESNMSKELSDKIENKYNY